MNKINTDFLERCVKTLEKAYKMLLLAKPDDIELDYDMYRSAVIKEFEVILEQSGKLLKKIITPYSHSKKAVDRLTFKDVFRNAGHHGLLTLEEVERWLEYGDNRNLTAHDYGFDLADKTLPLMPNFINDTNNLIRVIGENDN
ncbi:nucleotidyltransferase substrate binding protein [Francisellaceae bacterium CB299]